MTVCSYQRCPGPSVMPRILFAMEEGGSAHPSCTAVEHTRDISALLRSICEEFWLFSRYTRKTQLFNFYLYFFVIYGLISHLQTWIIKFSEHSFWMCLASALVHCKQKGACVGEECHVWQGPRTGISAVSPWNISHSLTVAKWSLDVCKQGS